MKIEITLTETVAGKTFGQSAIWDFDYIDLENSTNAVFLSIERIRVHVMHQKIEAGIVEFGVENVACRFTAFIVPKVIYWRGPLTETTAAQIAKLGVEQYEIECRHMFDRYRPDVLHP